MGACWSEARGLGVHHRPSARSLNPAAAQHGCAALDERLVTKSTATAIASAVSPHQTTEQRQQPSEAIFNLPSCDLVRFLGQGMLGTVVLVRERATGTFYAVKVMSLQRVRQRGQERNVQLELEIVRNCGAHPFIVKVEAGYQTRQALVLVLEYVSGGDMYNLLERYGYVSEDALRFYVAEVALALGHLHARGYVCRDLKVENVLIDRHGHVRLTDFGLAGRDADGCIDRSGTPLYQAPEVLRGERHGRQVDWWALGVLAYFLLAGTPPFYAPKEREVYRMILDERYEPPWCGGYMSQASETCRDLIRRLLDRNPQTRLGSGASQVANDVDEVLAHPFFTSVSRRWLGEQRLVSPTLRSMMREDDEPGIDIDKFLRYQVVPPLEPAKQPAEDFEPADEEAMRADENLYAALTGDNRPQSRHVTNMVDYSREASPESWPTPRDSLIPGYKVYIWPDFSTDALDRLAAIRDVSRTRCSPVARTRDLHLTRSMFSGLEIRSEIAGIVVQRMHSMPARVKRASKDETASVIGDHDTNTNRAIEHVETDLSDTATKDDLARSRLSGTHERTNPLRTRARCCSVNDHAGQLERMSIMSTLSNGGHDRSDIAASASTKRMLGVTTDSTDDESAAISGVKSRASIGLNFSGSRRYLFERTWTGTDDDEGRVYRFARRIRRRQTKASPSKQEAIPALSATSTNPTSAENNDEIRESSV
ncbi:hypothetical protein F1559_005043 [Cyanidiococcus yangmingshanensis]|uniref:non-specific serine/threonine protein kinase n=1 Tax=Cyanidiococcus yangmingshanensis TaxID=2690220 RepID=A0A7J7ISC5_9RHOD|nr:hypothetical protein F1559_005043 [Cyanidiococcus yangmingshanensis]